MSVNIIVAFCKKFGIGNNGTIPWSISDDLKYFKKITESHIVVMGRKTYFTIPKKYRPLKNRLNIVITNNPDNYNDQEDAIFRTLEGFNNFYTNLQSNKQIFIIGGEELYKCFLDNYEIDKIYATQIDHYFECDRHFPHFINYKLLSASPKFKNNEYEWRYLIYQFTNKIHPEYVYLNLIQNIMEDGIPRYERTGIGTRAVFGRQLRFDISDSIPLLTTRFISWRTVILELLWFLRGETNSLILEKDGINIWKGNTSQEFLDNNKLSRLKPGEIGQMYGHLWRHYGAKYIGCDADYTGQGIDQLQRVIEMLRNEPYSRRIMMTTYNPSALKEGVLEPCHGISLQFFVEDSQNGKLLSACMLQRSADSALGLPYNIASYTALIYIIAKLLDMHPKELIINTNDTHIYNNHIDQVELQLLRKPYPWPKLIVSDGIKNKKIEDIDILDFELKGYLYWPAIKMEMAI